MFFYELSGCWFDSGCSYRPVKVQKLLSGRFLLLSGRFFKFLKVTPTIGWAGKKILISRSCKTPIFAFLLCNFQNKKKKTHTSLFFTFLVSDWVTIHLWCIFYNKNKTLLTWSSWPRLYNSLYILEKAKLCYILFYTGKIPQAFLKLLVSLESHLFLLHDNVCIGDVSFILFLRFSIAEEKTKMACEMVSNWFMQLRQLQGYQNKSEKIIKKNKIQILE